MLFGTETHAIIGAAMAVHTKLGSGFLEAVYQEALAIEFATRKIPHIQQAPIAIYYDGQKLNKKYYADYLCYQAIIVEIKALSTISNVEMSQTINYLVATALPVGLLFNFGHPTTLEWKRLYNNKQCYPSPSTAAIDSENPFNPLPSMKSCSHTDIVDRVADVDIALL